MRAKDIITNTYSRWDRYTWNPLIAAVPLIFCTFAAIRRPSLLNVVFELLCVIYFASSATMYLKQRRQKFALTPQMMGTDESEKDWYDRKSAIMKEVLGKEHDMVMHAIIPYAVGGALDLYYYQNGQPGVAIATKEISSIPDSGPSNAIYRQFELVMFTKSNLNLDMAKDERTDFGRAHRSISSVLNHLAPYSMQATLNANETLEFPKDMEHVGGKCFIIDAYANDVEKDEPKDFGLLAIIEIFRSEMEYAREYGGAILIDQLKISGHYPYSDLDRDPVA